MEEFEKLKSSEWSEIFNDSCTEDWSKNWTLDGKRAAITHSEKGMDYAAGPINRDDNCHAVLWTKQSFEGDIKIEYEYTKLDETVHNVTIIYIFATGKGTGDYDRDISQWAHLREVASMGQYFNHMNTYHISYAAFAMTNTDPDEDYIRLRRYMPDRNDGLNDTDLQPDYSRTGLFKTGVPHRITIIKKGEVIYMHIQNGHQEQLCQWEADAFPPIVEGRIGLRHMYTRSARYRDFRVSVLSD